MSVLLFFFLPPLPAHPALRYGGIPPCSGHLREPPSSGSLSAARTGRTLRREPGSGRGDASPPALPTLGQRRGTGAVRLGSGSWNGRRAPRRQQLEGPLLRADARSCRWVLTSVLNATYAPAKQRNAGWTRKPFSRVLPPPVLPSSGAVFLTEKPTTGNKN